MPVSDVARQLDIHYNSLYRWIREYEEYGESAFPGHGCTLYNYQYEINKLKNENKNMQEELELLKKFRAFLKKKSV
jgi:transposase